MARFPLRTGIVALTAGLSLTLSACVVAPPGRYYGPLVRIAPPPPPVQYYGAPPYPGYVWIGGYWRWAPRGYVWVRGRWTPPRVGFHWIPRRWVHTPRGWRMAGGRWIRDRY